MVRVWYTLPSHVTIIARIGCGLRKEKVEKMIGTVEVEKKADMDRKD